MPAFLFKMEFAEFSDSLMATIPEHRVHIEQLMDDGILLSYCVSAKRDFTWCVVRADSELQAMDVIVGFPMYKFYIDVTCHPLMFYNSLSPSFPGISLN